MDSATEALVRTRAKNRCEYCTLPQSFSALSFHIEHVIARQHGGSDLEKNLALACPECNLRKGPNIATVDPEFGTIVPLFNPRTDSWQEHFENVEGTIMGKTATGRGTEALLAFNSPDRVRLRRKIARLQIR
jgi:hypothetical protein